MGLREGDRETKYHVKLQSPYNESILIGIDYGMTVTWVQKEVDKGSWRNDEVFVVEVKQQVTKVFRLRVEE